MTCDICVNVVPAAVYPNWFLSFLIFKRRHVLDKTFSLRVCERSNTCRKTLPTVTTIWIACDFIAINVDGNSKGTEKRGHGASQLVAVKLQSR